MTTTREAALSAGLLAIGVAYVVQGIWAGVAAASFTASLADFGPANDHLVHDYAAATTAIGVGLLLAVRQVSWRRPVLVVTLIWNGLHTLSHIVSVPDAASRTLGLIEATALAATTVLLGVLAVSAGGRT